MSYKKLGRVCEAVRRIDKSKEAQEVKNFEHPLYTESELGAMTKVQLQGLYLRFYGTDSGRLREGGLIKAILKAESELKNPAESTGTEKGERTMTKITEETLEGYQSEIEKIKTRPEAESFLEGLTVKELKALYKYLVMFAYGEWYRMRKAEFIEEILDYYFEREIEESTEETSEVTEETKAALKNLTAEDDFNAMSAKMCHNNEEIEKATTETELEDLLNTADEYTLRYMLHRKGYETEKAEDECVKCELVTAYVKEEMQLRREAKALDKLGHSGLIAKTRELKKQLDACNSECEMEEVLKSYTKAELVMMSANINTYSLKINYLQSRDKLARDFAHEYWFMTRTLSEAEKNLTEKKHVTETTENTSCYELTDEMYKEIYEERQRRQKEFYDYKKRA